MRCAKPPKTADPPRLSGRVGIFALGSVNRVNTPRDRDAFAESAIDSHIQNCDTKFAISN